MLQSTRGLPKARYAGAGSRRWRAAAAVFGEPGVEGGVDRHVHGVEGDDAGTGADRGERVGALLTGGVDLRGEPGGHVGHGPNVGTGHGRL